MTPAYAAATHGGACELLQLLLQAKADVDKATTTNGSTPALSAAGKGDSDMLRVLVEAKADVDKGQTDSAVTPAWPRTAMQARCGYW